MSDDNEWLSLKEAGALVKYNFRTVHQWIITKRYPLITRRSGATRRWEILKSSLMSIYDDNTEHDDL